MTSAASFGTPITTAAKGKSWRATPLPRCNFTGSSLSAWSALRAASRKSATKKATPTSTAALWTRASGPGPRHKVRSLMGAHYWSPMRPNMRRNLCSTHHDHPTGAVTAWCLKAGSSGKAVKAVCTTGCVTHNVAATGCESAWHPEPRSTVIQAQAGSRGNKAMANEMLSMDINVDTATEAVTVSSSLR